MYSVRCWPTATESRLDTRTPISATPVRLDRKKRVARLSTLPGADTTFSGLPHARSGPAVFGNPVWIYAGSLGSRDGKIQRQRHDANIHELSARSLVTMDRDAIGAWMECRKCIGR